MTTAAATAALLQIAAGFSGASHHKTLVFVSTDGVEHRRAGREAVHPRLHATPACSTPPSSSASRPSRRAHGTAGDPLVDRAAEHREPAQRHRQRDRLQGGGDTRRRRGPAGRPLQARAAGGARGPGPAGRGGPARRCGSPRTASCPSTPGRTRPDNFNTDTFARFGRASLELILSLDATSGVVQHGPSGYIGVAGNLLPGWTIAMLALALLLPVAVGAGAGPRLRGAQPDGGGSRPPLGRAAGRALPRRAPRSWSRRPWWG